MFQVSSIVFQAEEKVRNYHEKFELAEQRLMQSQKKADALPTVEAELQQRLVALSQAEERHGSTEENMQQLSQQLTDKETELQRVWLHFMVLETELQKVWLYFMVLETELQRVWLYFIVSETELQRVWLQFMLLLM